MLRNLTLSVLRYERVKTTEAKAKEVRVFVDRMINLGKDGSLVARRRALSDVCDEAVRVTGAGRTDAGVHASGQVIDFRTASALDGATIGRGVNALLPQDIAVSAVEPATEDFHARFSATGRTYEYRIRHGRERDPLERRRELHVGGTLDLAAMRDASALLVGRRDFSSFAAGPGGVRSVRRAEWCQPGTSQPRFEGEAEAFLRGLVPPIRGT